MYLLCPVWIVWSILDRYHLLIHLLGIYIFEVKYIYYCSLRDSWDRTQGSLTTYNMLHRRRRFKWNGLYATNFFYIIIKLSYSWFHIKGTWSVHSFNGDYLSIPECTGSCEYIFYEIPGSCIVYIKYRKKIVYANVCLWKSFFYK